MKYDMDYYDNNPPGMGEDHEPSKGCLLAATVIILIIIFKLLFS